MTGATGGLPIEERLVIRRAPGAGSDRHRPSRGGRGWADPEAEERPGARWTPAGTLLGSRSAALGPLLAWTGSLVLALVALGALGRTPLASPPVTDPAAWWHWAQLVTADQIAFNVLRILGLGLAWYLLGVTTVGALARLAHLRGLVEVADRLTVGPVRRLLQASLGMALATSVVAQVPGTAAQKPQVSAVEMVEPSGAERLQPVVPGAIGLDVVARQTVGTLVAEAALVDDRPVGHDGWRALLDLDRAHAGDALSDGVTGQAGSAQVLEVGEATATQPANRRPDADGHAASSGSLPGMVDRATHQVVAGDHFWSIARDRLGRGASEDDIATYWRQLVQVNRSRLVDAGNPDLLLPGQVLVLPAIGGVR